MPSRFHNSTTIITGAASGIGRELALQAAARGARVIATDINPMALQETAALAATHSLALETHVVDVSKPDEIEAFAQKILPTMNAERLILVNNAGVALLGGHWWDMTLEDTEWLLSINQMGVIRMTRAFLPSMLAQNDGHIVNISSVFGFVGMAQHLAYCTSKFAVRGFTEALRMELLTTNIETTCVHPGGIKTNVTNNARRSGELFTEQMVSASHEEFTRNAFTTAASAARQIVRAVEKRKRRLLIGADAWGFDALARLFPVRYTSIIAFVMNRFFENPYQQRKRLHQ